MLKITETRENGSTLRLRLDGNVSAESFDELAELCKRRRVAADEILIVDMSGVSFMSHDAARHLVDLRSDSLRIINCSPFIAALLEAANSSE